MAVLKHMRIVLFVVAGLVAVSYSAEECSHEVPRQLLCPGIKRYRRGPGSVTGIWYLYAATPMKTPQVECGLFNNVYPCGCISLKADSNCTGDYTTDFVTNIFGYNFETNKSGIAPPVKGVQLETVDYSEIAQYTATNNPAITFQSAILGTDNKETYAIYYLCSHLEGIKTLTGDSYIWFLSRTPVPTIKSIWKVNQILMKNGFPPDILQRVKQTNCKYPWK